ncbi:hypothetical protein ABMA28_012746 [Loxostege sticticalis]|uniref:RNA-binding protein 48 n=1 Tax=Loxostege sticticalis TaxID=481309 RepID=A0ABD0S502_LOXSC
MEPENKEEEVLLPHHEQQSLCTTRLPYRQGRKLTAVKVYTVNNESNHLLVFGVPSLNLRQEAKALFSKFGKLLQFNISKEHAAEVFTETYHAMFEKIQSARMAKRMLDMKNFYGGSLHVCYAPEFEDVNETRRKLLQRQKDVIFRLRNIQNDTKKVPEVVENVEENPVISETKKINMGEDNMINLENNTVKKRKNREPIVYEKRFKPCFDTKKSKKTVKLNIDGENNKQHSMLSNNDFRPSDKCLEIIDCTSTNLETVTNINEPSEDDRIEKETETSLNEKLNYNNFGNEVVRKIAVKAVNKIKFSLNKR